MQVFIRNVLGVVVRRMDAGWVNQGNGQFSWNGRNDANQGVLPGTYTYRVHVTDEAGNTVLSTESKPFIVVLGLLPLLSGGPGALGGQLDASESTFQAVPSRLSDERVGLLLGARAGGDLRRRAVAA